MATGFPLLFGWRFDGQGGGRALNWADVIMVGVGDLHPCWLHLNRNSEATIQWLIKRSGLDAFVVESLMALETRPRCLRHGDGILLYFRAVNLNEGAEVHDMLSIRFWVDQHGVISLRRRRLITPEDISFTLQRGEGPTGPGDLLVAFIEQATERMEAAFASMRDRLETLEQATLEEGDAHAPRHRVESKKLRSQLGRLRIGAISLRRYLGPQRDALLRLAAEHPSWLTDEHRTRIREMVNETTRYIEDMDEIRDTAGIIQDQIASAQSDAINVILYQLTLATVFFMPLSFLVGFFGSNTGGMFFGGDPSDPAGLGATYEMVLLVVLAVVEIVLFRSIKWI